MDTTLQMAMPSCFQNFSSALHFKLECGDYWADEGLDQAEQYTIGLSAADWQAIDSMYQASDSLIRRRLAEIAGSSLTWTFHTAMILARSLLSDCSEVADAAADCAFFIRDAQPARWRDLQTAALSLPGVPCTGAASIVYSSF